MTTLDYATVYETQFRRRQRLRRTLLGLAAVLVSAVPLGFMLLSGLGRG
jgi:hypothetical protein